MKSTCNAEILARRATAVPRGLAASAPVAVSRALNAELWDLEGRRYIDFAGGIGVLNVGHCHPKVVAAVERQLAAFTHTSIQVTSYAAYVALSEALNGLAPTRSPSKTLLVTTGAEAVENAVKIARAATGRPAVVAFGGAFHGRTIFTLGLTGKVNPYKVGFGPFPGEIFHVPFPNAFRGVTVEAALGALETLFRSDVDPDRVAAVLIEPVQGEGGFNVAPFDFLRELRETTDRHGILLIVDEIQSGFGRTGRFFAIEHSGVVPDLITSGKSLAGGFPLAAVTGRSDVMDAVPPGGLGGTYSGNPLACAAALAVIDIIREERLLERSMALGAQLMDRLNSLQGQLRCIGDIRGLGGMVAFELVSRDGSRRPDRVLAARAIQAAANRGLVLLACGMDGNVIRILAPLTAAESLIEEGLEILESALREANRDAL